MGIAAKHIDRLLPRHESAKDIDLAWNVRTKGAGLFKKGEEISDVATILDISLEGALVSVTDRDEHRVGDHLAVRFRGLDGEAIVRHRRESDDDALLYGVSFTADLAFRDAVDQAVGEIRGHASELTRAWQRQN